MYENTLEVEVEELASQLQRLNEEDGILALEETYDRLQTLFSLLLFRIHHVPEEHYAWLLMNQDATSVLEKLTRLYSDWLASGDDELRLAYKVELDDFKFIISTAILCRP